MTPERMRLFFVDLEPELLTAVEGRLREGGAEVLAARGAAEALRLLARKPAGVVTAVMPTGGSSGLGFLRDVKARCPGAAVVVLAAAPTIREAVEAIKLGASEYLEKPFSAEELLRSLARLSGEPVAPSGPPRRIVGSHPGVRQLREAIAAASRLDATVLVCGESGTGKELVARAIHEQGPSPDEPFLAVNCGAFTRSLLEDQLFGHSRGAFTGALEDQDGLFVAAGRGTLFLDEITEMDLDLQARLLRAVQEREVVPLGTNRPVPFRARLIAATNRELEPLLAAGRFRRDLYYRINVVQIRVPPLRDRIEDIPALAETFLDDLARSSGRRKTLSPEALELLLRHTYPGNVRELRNALERAHALGVLDEIQPRDLPRELQSPEGDGFKPLREIERDHILRALRLAGGKKSLAARFLKVDRNRLNRMMKRHRIAGRDVEEGDGLN